MKQFWKEAFLKAIPGFLSLTLTVIFFFLIFRYEGISRGFSAIMNILKPFIYGGVMAYLLKTPYNWIEKFLQARISKKRQGLVRVLSAAIVMVLAFVIIYLLLSMVIPALVDSIVRIINKVPAAVTSFESWVYAKTNGNEVINNYIDQGASAIQTNGMGWVRDHILPRLQSMMGGVASTFGTILGTLYNVIIGIIICVYLLLSKSLFARQGKMVIYGIFPKNLAEKILDEFTFIDKTFVGFFAGKILDSTVVGLICYVFCLIMHFTMGLQNAVLIAVIVGVTNIIPYFGPYIGAIPSALLILMDSPVNCVIFIIFILILQQFDGNVLGPMLLSESVGLSGFWVLFSITFFGGIMGFAGVLVGVPVFAVIYDLIRRFIYYCLDRRQIDPAYFTEKEVIQEIEAEKEGIPSKS
ncbi:MAG: AI-2E family transporter [Eubacterium sp.]|nr:AI-2E family transporter [Eubacterium sp.]